MPWCATCERYLTPPSVRTDGTCPACETAVEAAPSDPRRAADREAAGAAGEAGETLPPVPWHFKLLLGAVAVYLGYRFWEIGAWLLRRL